MVQTLLSQAPRGRVQRHPKHKFNIRVRPYQVVPCMIAPVLPGETLESVYFEAREVSDPINSPIIQWKGEFHLFYVKIRDLADAATIDDLFTNPTASVSSLNVALDAAYYHSGGSPNYTKKCLQRVVETYYRDEGETWNANDIGNYPSAQFRDQAWMDSIVDTTTLSAGSGDPGASTSPEALDALMDAYEQLRAQTMTSMSFEDYLQLAGVRISKAMMHKPEKLMSCYESVYPANTINASTGAPTSACSWVYKKVSRDRKAFTEPGFILGTHTVRPKIYVTRQYGSMAHFLDRGMSWLPTLLQDMPETSLREFTGGAAGNGPLSNGTTGPTNGYWVDMRDLFHYGDQMFNYTPDSALNGAALPDVSLVRKYLTGTMVDGFFVSASPSNQVRSDGFFDLSIAGKAGPDYTGGHQVSI